MLRWHVLYTKPHAEFQVLSALEARGIESYLPALAVPRPRAGRPSKRAFFPCYLFARFDLELLGESAVVFLPGVRNLVLFASKPAIVGEHIIRHLRARLAQPMLLDSVGEILRHGDSVEILDEPFRNMDAVFDRRLNDEGRVRVFLHYLETHELARDAFEHAIALDVDIALVKKKAAFQHRPALGKF